MRRAWIPLSIKRAIAESPCVVCGVLYGIKVDHILSVRMGGGPERSNLQPLCHDCNHIKGAKLNNFEVLARVRRRGLTHFERAVSKHDNRYINSFDRQGLREWRESSPHRVAHAFAAYMVFLARNGVQA